MKTRESGMPDEVMWRSFFEPEGVLSALKLDEHVCNVVDFGCGYGTFALPAARRIKGLLHGLDIDAEMIEKCEHLARCGNVHNIRFYKRDIMESGTGLSAESVDYVMVFNMLHAEQPLLLLCEARRILRVGGRVSVMHWNYDPGTPRGPSMAIRPRPEDCGRWIEKAGFVIEGGVIDLPPYHYGLIGKKKGSEV